MLGLNKSFREMINTMIKRDNGVNKLPIDIEDTSSTCLVKLLIVGRFVKSDS